MPDRDQQSRDEASKRTVPATGGEQSRGKSAGDAGNPQDGPDTGSAGASRPRGKTEDPDRTL